MIAGVPGAGISAFFYLFAVLAMPFVAAWRAVRSGSLAAGRWRLVLRQVSVGVGIALGLLLGGAMVTLIVASAAPSITVEQATQVAYRVGETLGRVGIALGLITLVLVLGSVQVAALVFGRRRATPAPRWASTRQAPSSDRPQH